MTKDLTQLNNVAEHHPDVVEKLAAKVTTWAKTLPEGPHDPTAGQMHSGMPGDPPRAQGKRKNEPVK